MTSTRSLLFHLLPLGLAGGFLLSISLACRQSLTFTWGPIFFAACMASPHIVVGSIVWYSGHQRSICRLFFAHCVVVVMLFALLPAHTPLLVSLMILAAISAVMLLFRFLRALSPGYLACLEEIAPRRIRTWQWYQFVVESGGIVCGLGVLLALARLFPLPVLATLLALFGLLSLGGCGVWSILAYRGTEAPRERAQWRLIWLSVAIAALPSLALQVLPKLWHLSTVPTWLSLLSLPAFPLALGYTAVRDQLVLPDRAARQVTLWLLRGLLFPLLIALIVETASHWFPATSPDLAVCVVVSMTVFGPLFWWGTNRGISFLFTQNLSSLQTFLTAPPPVASLEEAAALLSSAMNLASGSSQVYFCLCPEEGQICLPLPPVLPPARMQARQQLLQRAHDLWGTPWSNRLPYLQLPDAIRSYLEAHPWLPLHQWERQELSRRVSWRDRWFSPMSDVAAQELLLFPLRPPKADHLVGLLFVGPAEDRQPYAGADLERMLSVVEAASPWLARYQQEEETRRQDQLLGQMYGGLALMPPASSVKEIVQAYVDLAASWGASVEVFWQDVAEEKPWLRAGMGPWLTSEERCALSCKGIAGPRFYSSGEGAWSCAVALLPLAVACSSLVLLVTYSHPFVFLSREQKYWQILTLHCQDRLEALADKNKRRRRSGKEQATLLTALTAHMELALRDQRQEAQAIRDLKHAVQATQRLLETSVPCRYLWCPGTAACPSCSHVE